MFNFPDVESTIYKDIINLMRLHWPSNILYFTQRLIHTTKTVYDSCISSLTEGEVKLEKSAITLKYAMDAERILFTTYFRIWIRRRSILSYHLIYGYCNLIFISYTTIYTKTYTSNVKQSITFDTFKAPNTTLFYWYYKLSIGGSRGRVAGIAPPPPLWSENFTKKGHFCRF